MAKKYIDAGRLKELIDAKYKEFTEKAKKDCPLQYQYMADGLDIAEQFVDSLQQEQPEVDLEKELDKFFGMYRKDGKTYDITDNEEVSDWKEDGNSWFKIEFARYFYELGLNARKEEQI